MPKRRHAARKKKKAVVQAENKKKKKKKMSRVLGGRPIAVVYLTGSGIATARPENRQRIIQQHLIKGRPVVGAADRHGTPAG